MNRTRQIAQNAGRAAAPFCAPQPAKKVAAGMRPAIQPRPPSQQRYSPPPPRNATQRAPQAMPRQHPPQAYLERQFPPPQRESAAEPAPPALDLIDWVKDKHPYTAVYCNTEAETRARLAQFDTANRPVSFDMEWSATFTSGKPQRPTALIQLSNQTTLLLVHIACMNTVPSELWDLLQRRDVVKFGANIVSDAQKLYRDFGVTMGGLVELQHLAGVFDKAYAQRQRKSLHSMVEDFLGRALDKSRHVRLSQWDRQYLQPAQIAYAANDIYAGDLLWSLFAKKCRAAGINMDELVSQLLIHVDVADSDERAAASPP